MSKIITFKCYYCEYNIKHKIFDSDEVTEEQQFNHVNHIMVSWIAENSKVKFEQTRICNNCQVQEKMYIDHFNKWTKTHIAELKKDCIEVASDTSRTFENTDHVQKKRDPKTCLSCGTRQNRHKDMCEILFNETLDHCLRIGYITYVSNDFKENRIKLTQKGMDYIHKVESLSKEDRKRFNGIQKSRILYLLLVNGVGSETL